MITVGPPAQTSTPATDLVPATSAPADSVALKQTGAQLLASFPPRLVASSWPATLASRSDVLARVLSPPFALDNPAPADWEYWPC